MRTDYLLHDVVYARRFAEGHAGWQDAEALEQTLAALAAEFAGPLAPHSGRALEIGCGAGELSLWLAYQGFDVVGMDIAPRAIERARAKAREAKSTARFALGNVVHLGQWEPASFDFVLDGYCLHCVIGADRACLLAGVRHVLQPGGRFHVRTMCGEITDDHLCLSDQLRSQFDTASRCFVSHGVATRYIGTAASITREVEQAGFAILDVRVKPAAGTPDDLDELLLWAARA